MLRIRIRDPVTLWPLDPGSGIGFFPDPGSRIPNPYFWELNDNFLGKKLYNSLKIGPNFFLVHFKNKIIYLQFCEICRYIKKYDKKISYLSFVAVFGSGMGKKSGSRIRDKHPGSATLSFVIRPILEINCWFWSILLFGKLDQLPVNISFKS